MKKNYVLAVILLLFIIGFLYFPKNFVSPKSHFSKKEPVNIYLEFKKGGNLEYHSNNPNDNFIIDKVQEMDSFYSELESLEFDLWAPNRGDRDYSVYINLGEYRENKYDLKMSRINGDYVFFFKEGLYRNRELANKIDRYLEISKK
ncbi:hypothetical protein MACH07_22080 [Flagellimonas marinaquae]|uniref:Uncharacterized protein n=1 Tax=Flagellimonas marinaquae TaxID=254955 RepID=A0AA48I0A3_9FLAO|nr:hypothetical protein MACH07_22080 [Allomuricauda aquimarina]